MTCVSTYAPEIELKGVEWDFSDWPSQLFGCWYWFQLMLHADFECTNALEMWLSAAEVKEVLSLREWWLYLWSGAEEFWSLRKQKKHRGLSTFSYIIIGQEKTHIFSTYTCMSCSAQCSTETWTVRKMLDRKTKKVAIIIYKLWNVKWPSITACF